MNRKTGYTVAKMPPHRSDKQRLESLQQANRVRKLRALDKRLLKSRKIDARSLLVSPPAYWQGARIAELLLAIPAVGHAKVTAMLQKQAVSPSRTIGGLTEQQRLRLAEQLAHYYRR